MEKSKLRRRRQHKQPSSKFGFGPRGKRRGLSQGEGCQAKGSSAIQYPTAGKKLPER